MTYQEALDYLHGLGRFGWNLGLGRMQRLLELLDHPERRVSYIHIAGTNGKGSTAATIAAGLAAGGLRAGLYTSPHLLEYTERFVVLPAGSPRDRREMRPEEFARLVRLVAGAARAVAAETELGQPTEFEVLTAAAFLHFLEQGVEAAALEVGLGGRLDATNVIEPVASVITHVALDHQDRLGGTIEEIAAEKAAIIKPGRLAVIAPQGPPAAGVIQEAADRARAPVVWVRTAHGESPSAPGLSPAGGDGSSRDSVWRASPMVLGMDGGRFWLERVAGDPKKDVAAAKLRTPLVGEHQIANVATAAACLFEVWERGLLPFRGGIGAKAVWEAIFRGTAETVWPARFEVLSRRPVIILDGAHNDDGMESLLSAMSLVPRRRLVVVTGMLGDKDVHGMVQRLATIASEVLVTRPDSPRAAEPEALAGLFAEAGVRARAVPDVGQAVREAVGQVVQEATDALLICGSLYLAGAARQAVLEVLEERGLGNARRRGG